MIQCNFNIYQITFNEHNYCIIKDSIYQLIKRVKKWYLMKNNCIRRYFLLA